MRRHHVLATVVTCAFSASIALAAPIDDAKKLLQQGQAAKGLAVLESNLPANLQDAEYNYLLGIASLDAGRPGNAVFAFERTLAIDPNHPQARAELARALVALAEFEAARGELLQVKSMNPPPEVAAKVDQALADLDRLIAESKKEKTTTWAAYAELEAGYDTNINTAPNATSVFIPALGLPGTLSGFATAQESGLVGVNAGGTVTTKVGEGVDLFASINGRFRGHEQANFTVASLSEVVGVRYTRGKNQYSLGLTRFDQYIGQYHNDAQNGLYGEWRHELSRQDIVGAFGQYIEVKHPIVPFLDTNLIIGGGTWTHAFLQQGDPMINVVAYVGDDRDIARNPTISRQLYGASVRGEYKWSDDMKLFGNLSVQHSDYNGTNVWFRTQRKDDRYDVALGLAYKLDRMWTATPQYIYTRNQSTVGFNEFDRSQLLVTVRRDFY